MIGEIEVERDFGSEVAHRLFERRWIADARNQSESPTAQIAGRGDVARQRSKDTDGSMFSRENPSRRDPPSDEISCDAKLGFRHPIDPRDDDQIGVFESGERFAPRPCGKASSRFEQAAGVEQDDVVVALDAQMLRAVVENDEIDVVVIHHRLPRRLDAIGSLHDQGVGKPLTKLSSLVIQEAGVGGCLCAVAPSQHHHPQARGRESKEKFDERCLAGAAYGEIADTNRRHAEMHRPPSAGSKPATTPLGPHRVEPSQRREHPSEPRFFPRRSHAETLRDREPGRQRDDTQDELPGGRSSPASDLGFTV